MTRYLAPFVFALCCLMVITGCATDEPAVEEQVVEDPVANEPVAEEPVVAEPEAAQPKGVEEPADEPTALIVHSYHEGFAWTDAVDAGIREGLGGSGARIVEVYMDTKRNPDEEAKIEAGERAKLAMEDEQPAVVIASDDNAQEYFAKDYAGSADAPQFVFVGVNAEPEAYGYPAANVTGILERPEIVESVELLLDIVPGVETLMVLSDDSVTSDGMIEHTKALDLPVEIVAFEQPSTFEEWQALLLEQGDEADAIAVFMYHTVKASPDATESMDPQEVIAWTLENTEKPTVGILSLAVDDGVMCGVSESGEEQGLEAGRIAAEILGGKVAQDFPITASEEGVCTINRRTAEELGIDVSPELLETCNVIE